MAEDTTLGREPMLERRLIELAPHVAYPPTPPIAQTVRARLTFPEPRRRWWGFSPPIPRVLAFALFAAALSLAGVLAAWPQARTAVSERLGIRGVTVEQSPSGVRLPLPGAPLDLGERVSLEAARARAGFPVAVPSLAELGEPDAVHFAEGVPGGQVALRYAARPGIAASESTIGLLLIQFRGPRSPEDLAIFQKQLPAGTRVESVVVNGERGLWIEGASHTLAIPDRSYRGEPDYVRLAGNVLLWERGEVSLRLEGAISKEVALRIASSVR